MDLAGISMTKGHKSYCKNKAIYVSEYAAKQSMDKVKKRTGEDIHYYLCTECGYYHLGHRRKSK